MGLNNITFLTLFDDIWKEKVGEEKIGAVRAGFIFSFSPIFILFFGWSMSYASLENYTELLAATVRSIQKCIKVKQEARQSNERSRCSRQIVVVVRVLCSCVKLSWQTVLTISPRADGPLRSRTFARRPTYNRPCGGHTVARCAHHIRLL